MRRLATLAAVSLALLHASAPVSAQDGKPAPPQRVARLIRDLGAADFGVRQNADEQLARLGPGIRRELEAALESDDAEVCLRAQRLLDRVKVAELWSASIVHYAGDGEPLSKAFDALASQAGNHVLMGDHYAPATDPRLSLALRPAGYWESVDELCRRTGNHVRPNFDIQSAGLVVASGPPGKYPTAYAGPLRVQITSARRAFSEDLDYENRKSDVTHTFQLNLQLMWEDRLRLVAYTSQPELIEAVPNQGRSLAAAQPANAGWNVATSSTRQVNANLRIVPPPAAAKTLEVLRLKWGLVAVGDMQTANISPVQSQQRHQQDDLLVTIENVEQQSAARCELSLIVARELTLPEPHEILLEENAVALLDQHRRRYRLLSQTSSLVDRGVQMKLSFAGDSAESAPSVLQVLYPRLRSRREAEIVFHHVPLPLGRPE
jgi:predicted secreted protein